MTFLNATLIFGVAAIAVPIVLHLLARREPKKVVFPSIQLLTKRYESTRSRLQIRRWWLLALRIIAIAALAIALARPAIDRSVSVTWITIGLVAAAGVALLALASVALARGQSRTLSYSLAGVAGLVLIMALCWAGYTYASGPTVAIDQSQPVAIAIVLDNSPTTSWKTADDNRIDRMKEIASWMVARIPRTSRIAVVDRSAQPVAFSLDAASALSKIEQIQPLQRTQPIAPRLNNAVRLLRTSELPNRWIFVVTDLATSTWNEEASDLDLITSLSEDPSVPLTVFDLGEFDAPNRTLSMPALSDTTPPRGVPVPITTALKLTDPTGDPAANGANSQPTGGDAGSSDVTSKKPTQVTAELRIYDADPTLPVIRDGEIERPRLRNVDRTNVRITNGSTQEIVLTIPPLDVGSHHGEIRLVGDDAMTLDDVRYFTVQVLPPSSVLLVCDDEDESRTIGLTITAPFQLDDPNAEFTVQRIGMADLPVVRLAEFDAVVVIDPSRDAISDEPLADYVRGGGGLLLCLGPALGDESMKLDSFPDLVRRWRVPPPGTFLQVIRQSHGVISPLAQMTGGIPWNDYRITQYWQIQAGSGNNASIDSALMRYVGTEHVALLERTMAAPSDDSPEPDPDVPVNRSEGKCLIFTTPLPDLADPRDQWNDLFGSDAWPAFLLVRQMLEYLTGRQDGALVSVVGQPQVVPLRLRPDEVSAPGREDSSEFVQGESPGSRRLQVFPPGEANPIPINVSSEKEEAVIQDVSVSGTWWLRGDVAGAGFSVNLPDVGTSTNRVDASVLGRWFGEEGYRLATNRDEVEFAETESSGQVMLQSPAMLLALVVFLLEQILSNRFYPSRSAETGGRLGDAATT